MRLREIKQVNKMFGGCSLLLFGDPLQLKPVMGRYPWEAPTKDNYLKVHQIDPIWSIFKPIVLHTNHRQGEDKKFADVLNRIRVGSSNTCDLDLLKTRVVSRHDPRINQDCIFIFARNIDVNLMNSSCLDLIEGEEYTVEALVNHPTMKNYKPQVDNTGNIRNTNLQKILKFKEMVKNKNAFKIK